jgi:hypothetical protein
VATTIKVVEPKIVLVGVRAHEVVAAFRETKNDAARCVLPAGDRLESDRYVDVAVWAAWGEDDVEFVIDGALYQRAPIARRTGYFLDPPVAEDRFPTLR